MSKRKKDRSVQTNAVIRAFKVLDILKEETDLENTLTQNEILKKLIEEKYDRCTLKTLKDTLDHLKEALNPASHLKQIKEDFRIIHPGLIDESEYEDEEIEKELRMTDIYYNHQFSYDELDSLIEGIQFSKTLDPSVANNIIGKVKQLTNKYYKNNTSFINSVEELSILPKKELRVNLSMIQKAIEEKVKIAFYFNGYNKEKKLQPVSKKKYLVSPYYIAAHNGRYYLLANTEPYNNTSIYRIDLMTEIEIPEEDERLKKKGIPRRPKADIEGLPATWKPEEFTAKHLNMFYDDPIDIELKVKGSNYTYIHDSFGDRFKFLERLDDGSDLILVRSSPEAMVNWAIQYSRSVEVKSPYSLRKSIAASLEASIQKYK